MIIVALHQPFLDGLKAKNIKYELKDVKPLLDRIEKQMKLRPKSRDGSFDYVNQYHKLNEIYAELERLSKTNPKKVEVSSFGKSFQNMDLKVVKMFGGVLPKNKFVVIECGYPTPFACGLSIRC